MRALYISLFYFVLFTLAAFVGWQARAEQVFQDSNKLSKLLAGSIQGKKKFSILIQFKSQEKFSLTGSDRVKTRKALYHYLRTTALASQAKIKSSLQKKGFRTKTFYISNMMEVENANIKLLYELIKEKSIEKIFPNPVARGVKLFRSSGDDINIFSPYGIEENISRIGAAKAWEEFGAKGQGITVGIGDTGAAWQHPALKRQYRGSTADNVSHNYNWHDAIHKPLAENSDNKCGYNISAPCDDYGHGTHALGTIVGDDGTGNQIGVAPAAKWMACRNMDSGLGRPSTYIECFEFFLAPYKTGENPLSDGRPDLAADVINNSWVCVEGEGCDKEVFLQTLRSLKTAGIMVVAAAGNWGSQCKTLTDPPAVNSAETLSVGAFNHYENTITSFSSRGPSADDGKIGPDLVAPGVRIRSSAPGGYLELNGTSMAAPHVTGAVALLWSASPSLVGKVDKTSALLTSTADPYTSNQQCGGVAGTKIPNNTFGYGLINIYKAIKQLKFD